LNPRLFGDFAVWRRTGPTLKRLRRIGEMAGSGMPMMVRLT
jgi:hypothetical protein